MRYVFFSKMVRELTIPQLIQTLRDLGFDGVDLAVRDGYPVNPGNAREALPEAAKRFRDAGLEIGLVSTATNLVDPRAPVSEAILRACHDAGVREVKIGYWSYQGGDYWQLVDRARKDLEEWARIAAGLGVRINLHTHSGSYLAGNASAAMILARDHDPRHVGVYLDAGHLALNGEPLGLAFGIAAGHLSAVASKDSLWIRGEGGRPRQAKFVPLGEGLVDWRELIRHLIARDFQGPISLHSEYEPLTVEAILAQTKKDLAYLRSIEAEEAKRSR